jgi:WD40 repeat protein
VKRQLFTILNAIISSVLVLSACTNINSPANTSVTPPGATSVSMTESPLVTLTPVLENPWVTRIFYDENSKFSNTNPSGDGYMGRIVDGSQVVVDKDTRWDITLKVDSQSKSTGLIIEAIESDFSQPKIFLGYSEGNWKIGYAPHVEDYTLFDNLGMVEGLEAQLQLTIFSGGKRLEVKNGSQVVFSHIFSSPIFPNTAEVTTYTLCGPLCTIEISSLSISQNESVDKTEYAAQPTPNFPTFPAPVVPVVSAPISVQNASQLTRLASLGEGDLINSQLSPDGKYVLLGTSNGILVLDSTTLQKVSFLQSTMKPEEIYFFDDGKKVAALNIYHERGHVWSFPDGEEIREVKMACNLDPSGKNRWWLSFPSKNLEFTFAYIVGMAGLCRTSDGQPVYTLDYQFNNANFAVSPDEKLLAFSTVDKLVLIQYHDGKVLKEIPQTGIKTIFFYPDGKTLAATFENKTLFWNLEDYQLVDTLNGVGVKNHEDPSTFPFFSPDGSILVFRKGTNYRFVRAADREYIETYSGTNMQFTSDSQGIIVDSGTGQVNYYEINEDRSAVTLAKSVTGKGLKYYNASPGMLSEDKTKLLVAKPEDGAGGMLVELRIFELISGERTTFNEINLKVGVTSIKDWVWLPGLQTFGVLLGGSMGIPEFYTLNSNSKTLTKVFGRSPDADRSEIKFTSSSGELVFARGEQVTIWDIRNNFYTFPQEGLSAYSAFFIGNGKDRSPDGRYQVTLSEKANPGFRNSVLVSVNGILKNDFSGYSSLDYAFSPDGKMLAVSSFSIARGTNISVFNLATDEKLFFSGDYFSDGDFAPKITFSPDGKYLAVLPEAGYPQIWGIP